QFSGRVARNFFGGGARVASVEVDHAVRRGARNSVHDKYGPPTMAVITLTGVATGANAVRPTQSAAMIHRAPARAEPMTGTPRWRVRCRATSGAANETRPTGPATATAVAVRTTVTSRTTRRVRCT